MLDGVIRHHIFGLRLRGRTQHAPMKPALFPQKKNWTAWTSHVDPAERPQCYSKPAILVCPLSCDTSVLPVYQISYPLSSCWPCCSCHRRSRWPLLGREYLLATEALRILPLDVFLVPVRVSIGVINSVWPISLTRATALLSATSSILAMLLNVSSIISA